MLTLYPNSWLTSWSYVGIGSGGMDIFKGLSSVEHPPISVSFKPDDRSKNFMGNRETSHYQAHGVAMINDRNWQVYKQVTPNPLYPSAEPLQWVFPYYWRNGTVLSQRATSSIILYPCPLTFTLATGPIEGLQAGVDVRIFDDDVWFFSPIGFTTENNNRFRISFNGYIGIFRDRACGSNVKFRPHVPNDAPLYTDDGLTVLEQRESRVEISGIYLSGSIWFSAKYDSRKLPTGRKLFNFYRKWLSKVIKGWVIEVRQKDDVFVSGTYYYGTLPQIDPGRYGWKKIMKWKDTVRELIWQSLPRDFSKEKQILLGEATQSAADAALKFTGNTGTLIKEVIQLKSTILDLWKLLQGDVSPKSIANLWLSGRYGLRLTYQDTLDLATSVLEEINADRLETYSWSRGGVSRGESQVHCKLYFDPSTRNPLARGVAWLMEWDLFPSLANVWDIIPYSFVVDWFADVEGFLADIDANTYLSVMEVFSTCYSIKTTFRPSASAPLGLVGNHITFTLYERLNPIEPYQVTPTFSGNLPSTMNIIDGSSLIIQRVK